MNTNLSKSIKKEGKLKTITIPPPSNSKPKDIFLTSCKFIKVGGIEIY